MFIASPATEGEYVTFTGVQREDSQFVVQLAAPVKAGKKVRVDLVRSGMLGGKTVASLLIDD